jgi:hypothetical protein
LGACLECPKVKLELDACSLNVKKPETELLEKSHISVTLSPCEVCVSLKGKLVHATNENTMLVQDVAYLTSQFERTKLSEKMIEQDLSRVDECVTCSIHKLGLGYERCEDKGEISTKFMPSSTYKDEEETLKAKQISYPPNPKPSFNPKRAQKQTTNPSKPNLDGTYTCTFCGCTGHLAEFCIQRKRMEKRCVDYARNSYRYEFIDFPPHFDSRALPRTSSHPLSRFSHGPNHCSYDFGSRENSFVPRCYGYSLCPHHGDRTPCRHNFPTRGSYTHFEPRYLDGPHFPYHGSRPTSSKGEVQKTVKTSSGCMVKCWIPKIYLTNPSTEPSTSSRLM